MILGGKLYISVVFARYVPVPLSPMTTHQVSPPDCAVQVTAQEQLVSPHLRKQLRLEGSKQVMELPLEDTLEPFKQVMESHGALQARHALQT